MNDAYFTPAPASFVLVVCQADGCDKQFPMQMELKETLDDGSVLVRLPHSPAFCRECRQAGHHGE